jgi:murein DD-endopeptidase MepM/ murein hydrolase activator NlpD
VSVRRGQRVAADQVVGRAGPSLHFGARIGDAYVDPLRLLAAGRRRVRLVPDTERPTGAPARPTEPRASRPRLVPAAWLEWARRADRP